MINVLIQTELEAHPLAVLGPILFILYRYIADLITLHCALAAAQCIVIGPVCGFVAAVFVCLWVCYHDNSKLRASILTKLGL